MNYIDINTIILIFNILHHFVLILGKFIGVSLLDVLDKFSGLSDDNDASDIDGKYMFLLISVFLVGGGLGMFKPFIMYKISVVILTHLNNILLF